MSSNEQEISKNNNNKSENSPSLLDDISNYTMDKKLGEGRFSKVYLATHKLTSEQVAIKIIYKNDKTSEGSLSHIKTEIEILKILKHYNICKLYSVIENNERIYIIQEYIEGKDLLHFINQNEKIQIKMQKVILYFRQIISAVEYMDNMGIAHRDLKPENILITEKDEIKLVDFGLGSIYRINNINKLLKTRCGSPFYCAPEMIIGKKYYGNVSDIWSLGVILYYMLFNELPFYDVDIDRLYKKIIEGRYTIPKDKINILYKDAIDLINKILQKDPKKRIKIKDIIKHKWFNSETNKLNIGLNIDEIIIPIDEEIVDEIKNKFGYDKYRIINSVIKNEYDKIYCLYLILLEKKIKNGKKSVADLKSDLYIDYIKDEKNQIKNYDNNIENAIEQKLKYYGNLNDVIPKDERKGNNKNNNSEESIPESDKTNQKNAQKIQLSPKDIKNDNKENNINNSESTKEKSMLLDDLSNSKKYKNKSYKKSITTKNILNEKKLKKLKIIIEEKAKLINEHHNNYNKKRHKHVKIFKKFNTNYNNFNRNNQEENKNETQLNKNNTIVKSDFKNKSIIEKISQGKNDMSYKKDDKIKNNLKIDIILELSPSCKRSDKLDKLKKIKEIKKHISKMHNHRSIDITENSYKTKGRVLSSIENNFKIMDSLNNNNTTINGEISKDKMKKIKEFLIRKSNNNINNQIIEDELSKKKKNNFNKGIKIRYSDLTYLSESSNFHKENKSKKTNLNFYGTLTNFYKPKNNELKYLNSKKFETLKNSHLNNIKEINDFKDIKNKYNFTNLVSPNKKQTNRLKIKERINSRSSKSLKKVSNNNNNIINNIFEHPFDLNYIYLFKDNESAKSYIEKKLKKKKAKIHIGSKINSEKNINYICSKQSGLKFNIDIIKNKIENNFNKCSVYICKIKNLEKASQYEFYNFFKS